MSWRGRLGSDSIPNLMKTMLEEEEGTAGSKVWDRTVRETDRQCSPSLAGPRPSKCINIPPHVTKASVHLNYTEFPTQSLAT